MSHAKTAEPIEMQFGLRTRVGLRNHVLDGGPDDSHGKGNFEGKGRPIVKYRDTLPEKNNHVAHNEIQKTNIW